MTPWRLILAIYFLFAGITATTEVIPPPPAHYFNDYANVVSPATAQQLNEKLAQFERDTSNQFVVAIYPKMESDSSIEDFTVRVAQSWKAGQKLKNNGVVLFVFVQEHKLFIQVGYGLEGALPDALCKRIINTEITPRFKQGDFNGGLTAGVDAVIAATKGEYKGTGSTVAEHNNNVSNDTGAVLFGLFIAIVIIALIIRWIASARSYSQYSSGGYDHGMWYWLLYAMLNDNHSSYRSGGGWYSGGSSSSSGGGFFGGSSSSGFSGGGGSFGGGGAGGSW